MISDQLITNVVRNGPHDLGGVTSLVDQPINLSQHKFQWWEKQIDTLPSLLEKKGLLSIHAFRRHIESMEPTVYNTTSYFEKWAYSITKCMLEANVFTQQELDSKLGVDMNEEEVLYKLGDKVQVKYENYTTRWRKPHLRTPGYIFGKVGVIERFCGVVSNPETLAFGGRDTKKPIYRVRFLQKTVWPTYPGCNTDTIDVEITQNWLVPATTMDTPTNVHLGQHQSEQHEHSHTHDHTHTHQHEKRSQIEQNAVDAESPETPYQYLAQKLIELLLEKQVITRDSMMEYILALDKLDESPSGAVLVAHAWSDPRFHSELLKNLGTAAATVGIHIETPVVAVENTEDVHNVVVCTLCSCYPKRLLGRPPDWYKSRSYRSRVVCDPRSVLKEFGLEIPIHKTVRVHDSTTDLRYLVVPQRPQGTEGWTVEQLTKIITRDMLVGVALPKVK